MHVKRYLSTIHVHSHIPRLSACTQIIFRAVRKPCMGMRVACTVQKYIHNIYMYCSLIARPLQIRV